MITKERLKEVFNYNPSTGIFTWKISTNRRITVGSVAGTKTHKGYIHINIDGKVLQAHILAWIYVYGVEPEGDIDHKDHVGTNNRIENLRDVPHQNNLQNQVKAHKGNKSGFLGVDFNKKMKKFRSCLTVGGKQKHLGYFNTAEEAHKAYVEAKRKYHSTCEL